MSVARSRSSAAHFPRTESPMEFVGQPRPCGASGLLGVPGLSTLDLELDVDDDDGEVVIGIRPKSSPLPRRRSSFSDEDSEPEPPLCGSRRVSFADAKGLNLVQVKEFETWDVPELPGYEFSESKAKVEEEYCLSPFNFSRPLSAEELLIKVRAQKVELDTIELLPGTTIVRGVIRVLNMSFRKAVYVRTTLDTWSSHFDLLAEYMPGFSDSLTDCFSFKLTLVPPFGEQGVRVDFCLRYETPGGTFWANNNNANYVLFCQRRQVKQIKEMPRRESITKKSCLKISSPVSAAVEINSTVEDSCQENKPTDVSKHEEKVNSMKMQQISNEQTGTSKADGEKLMAESRQNSSQRNRRKAARMARIKDFFAQRDGGANGTDRDEPPPEANEPVKEGPIKEKQSDVQVLSEGSSKSEVSPVIAESLETCEAPTADICHDSTRAHDFTSNSEPEKSENVNLADVAKSQEGESAMYIPDNLLHPNGDHAPAECHNINRSVSTSNNNEIINECISDTGAEPAESVVSETSTESPKDTSFTFGTVVAPLYHQAFSGLEVFGGNPVQATQKAGDLLPSSAHTDQTETSCNVPTNPRGNEDNVHGNVIRMWESEQECSHTTPNSPFEEEEMGLSETKSLDLPLDQGIHSDQRCTDTVVVPQTILGHPHTVNLFHADVANPQISTESLHLQGEEQEDDVTHDVQKQTAREETAEDARALIKISLQAIQVESDNKVERSLDISFSLQPSQREPECVRDETEPENSGDGLNGTKCVPHLSHEEETQDMENEKKEAVAFSDKHGRTIAEFEENDTLTCREPKEPERHEMDAVSKQDGVCLSDSTGVKNWEMMVEEEEKNVLTDENESQAMGSEAEETEPAEKGQEKPPEDAGTVSENTDTTEIEEDKPDYVMEQEIAAAREADSKTTDADLSQGKQCWEEERNGDILYGKYSEEVEEELENAGDTKTDREEEVAEEPEKEKNMKQEVENEKHFAVMHEVTVEKVNAEEEEEEQIEEEEKGVQIVWSRDTVLAVEGEDQVVAREEHEELMNDITVERISAQEGGEENTAETQIAFRSYDKTALDCTDQVTGREEHAEEHNTLPWEETLAEETVVDADSVCFKERLEITPNEAEDDLSAPADDVDDNKESQRVNTEEGKDEYVTAEIQEEASYNSLNPGRDPSQDACDESKPPSAAEGGSCTLADGHEGEQPSEDSSSAESDSEDEVELYMHCLRAVHAGEQAQRDRSRDVGFSAGKSVGFSVSKNKRLSTPMPSISESLDEEQPLSCLQGGHEGSETTGIQTRAADLPGSSGQEGVSREVSCWKKKYSGSNIGKTLLNATLFVLFVVVAYYYDFLACLGLYVISVIWLCCQESARKNICQLFTMSQRALMPLPSS